MTKKICTGLNLAYGTKFYTDCTVLNKKLSVGDKLNGEDVTEVSDFNPPLHDETCQFVTTRSGESYIVVINEAQEA